MNTQLKNIMRTLVASTSLAISVLPQAATAGGVIGGAIDVVAPGAGTALDNAHRDFKDSGVVPGYKEAEEGLSEAGRRVVTEATVETVGPILAEAIRASRRDAVNAGVQPIPLSIKQALRLYFPDHILDKVRYRVGQGNELSLQANSFRFGDAIAIALEDVIVFRNSGLVQDLHLWAHELGHVLQYDRWGVNDFAKRYVRDHRAIEDEAERTANAFSSRYASSQVAQAHSHPGGGYNPYPGSPQSNYPQLSSLCRFEYGPRRGMVQDYSFLGYRLPIGAPCQDGMSSFGRVIGR